jgi:hypothetical protein
VTPKRLGEGSSPESELGISGQINDFFLCLRTSLFTPVKMSKKLCQCRATTLPLLTVSSKHNFLLNRMEASQKNGRVGFPGKNCARKPEEFPLLK